MSQWHKWLNPWTYEDCGKQTLSIEFDSDEAIYGGVYRVDCCTQNLDSEIIWGKQTFK
jgi:hypothetical protein